GVFTCTVCGETKTEYTSNVNTTFLFDDVLTETSSNGWYYEAVYWAYDLGVTNGTSATTFSPAQGCTRAQFVTFLYRLAEAYGEDVSVGSSNPFTDVSATAHADYYDAILWAVEHEITKGTSETTFSPDDTIRREEAVTFLYRYETMVSGEEPSVGDSSPFDDVIEGVTYSEYYTAILWAAAEEQGITNGTSATQFSPDDVCDRAMMVTFLYRYAAVQD
ncbi:MAG: S-layer homology domain-containing protein, partial [Oscillospiraceae bacterium]|nr:S-layer homology domain-containing protein [Oscillospiraceae bacterium]